MAITNLTVILLVIALCALFSANTQATSCLSEEFSKCESELWFKNSRHFKHSLKSKCLKENSHFEKRHRQHHICNNKSHDKKAIFSKWQKFADCRCKAALAKLSSSKEADVLACYQIARLNKATGEFVGELSIYKKNSKCNYGVAVEISKRILKKDDGYKNGFYHLKKSYRDTSHNIDRYYIHGKISKSESMNKIPLNKVSPSKIKLLVGNDKTEILGENQFAVVPFSNFILSEDNPDENNPVQKDRDRLIPDDKKPNNEPNDKPNNEQNNKSPQSPNQSPPPADQPPSSPPADQPQNQSPADQPQSQSPADQPQSQSPAEQPQAGPQNDNFGYGNSDTSSTSTTTSPTVSSANSSEEPEKEGGMKKSATIGLLVFVSVIGIGAAFIGYNTYERVKWRRQYRRRQAAQQNFPIANVPDYVYGRAY